MLGVCWVCACVREQVLGLVLLRWYHLLIKGIEASESVSELVFTMERWQIYCKCGLYVCVL